MAEEKRSPSTTGREGVRVSLRGADISPIKTATMKNLVYLQRRLMRDGDLLESDAEVESIIIDNGLATMRGFVDALNHEDRDVARAAWNEWWDERRRTPNDKLFELAQRTLIDITFDLKEAGMLDLRKRQETSEDDGEGYEDILAGGSLVD